MLDWGKYAEIADKFQHKVKYQDRQDMRQDIIVRLADVELKYNGAGKTLSPGGMVRVASYTIMEYWRELMRLPAITNLSEMIDDGDGNEIEIYQVLADDKAIDIDNWLNDKLWLHNAPFRLVKIAWKKAAGYTVTNRERAYLQRFRKNGQKRLL